MFRHRGKWRTYEHNLKLAALLSYIAGIVNISGVLSVKVLTTNVTGHFAFFAEEISKENYLASLAFLCYILAFLSGSFVSGFIIEMSMKNNRRITNALPMMIEISILLAIGIWGNYFKYNQLLACVLLFTMGMQNSLVTQVSQSTVRTTHLTGLFTDLGIELSQLFFYKEKAQQFVLKRSIYLRLAIITFFFIGCVSGGFLYQIAELKTLLFAAMLLFIALFYDYIKLQFYIAKRKIRELR